MISENKKKPNRENNGLIAEIRKIIPETPKNSGLKIQPKPIYNPNISMLEDQKIEMQPIISKQEDEKDARCYLCNELIDDQSIEYQLECGHEIHLLCLVIYEVCKCGKIIEKTLRNQAYEIIEETNKNQSVTKK